MSEFGIVVIRACARLFPDGAAVAQLTVNQRVVGSNPTRGARICYNRVSLMLGFFSYLLILFVSFNLVYTSIF